MDRNEFIKKCGFACLGVIGISSVMQSCSATRQLNASVVNNKLQVPITAFLIKTKSGEPRYKRFVVVRNEQLNYPIVIYREQDNNYTSLLLRCSHQYNELNVNGELLTCPAHGSEFDAKGNVVTGPAENKLRSFLTTADNQHIYIQLA